ncbi:uncharacterized protein LOC117587300 [Drosophila guanche]|uniref:uncharacterized protein LOC117587300 n=1 Tax=Drosophila guanche TaxID=7266 RepID=UPI001471F515|nr:uncharacterized protein LOC117587300 [Drosophila guanche]XP_034133784.1 uncharacterized protein LOC117587300 [Drosophila guanche]
MSLPMSFEREVLEYQTVWEFLKKIKMESVFEDLKAAEATYDCLKFMIPEDVRDTIRKVGPRAKFRERILRMQRTEFGSIKHTRTLEYKTKIWTNLLIALLRD